MQQSKPYVMSYGNNGFRVAGHDFIKGNLMLTCSEAVNFVNPYKVNSLELEDILFLKDYANKFEYLVVGCGLSFTNPSIEIRKFIKECNFALEWVNTKFACHAWNDIIAQDDSVFAILLAV